MIAEATKGIIIIIVLLGILLSSYAQNDLNQEFNYSDYANTLKTYVDNQGMVNYKGLKANREKLDSFVSSVAKLNREVYGKWSVQEKIAFWINLYNGFTLKVIIDNYPIKSSFLKSRIYPKNSIRQISGVWDKLNFTVMGQNMTLDGIEHETLRKNFNEPRVHMALVCAAIGCPLLRNEPYIGGKLDNKDQEYLEMEKYKIKHLDYDWSLNEQK